jgi:chemotaxis protein CheY-P-specific phosphatase CheC
MKKFEITQEQIGTLHVVGNGKLWHGNKGRANVVFQRGQWASIIQQMTKEQIEKELGYKIEIV